MKKPSYCTQNTSETSRQSMYINSGFTIIEYTPSGAKKPAATVYWKPYTRTTGETRYHAMGFLGGSKKPAWNFIFEKKTGMDEYKTRFFERVGKNHELKEARAKERREFVPTIKPGDILDTCWGYEQTNVEFFQVISIRGKTAVLREIGKRRVQATGPFSAEIAPIKDHFVGNEITRRVSIGNYVRIDDVRFATPMDGETSHESWGH